MSRNAKPKRSGVAVLFGPVAGSEGSPEHPSRSPYLSDIKGCDSCPQITRDHLPFGVDEIHLDR